MHMVVMVTICGTSNYVAGVQVNFLGTGSAEPSKYRGASAIHIRSLTPYPPPCLHVQSSHGTNLISFQFGNVIHETGGAQLSNSDRVSSSSCCALLR